MRPLSLIHILAPVCAFLFNYFSLSAFILNLPVAALAAVILPLGILACLLSFSGGILLGVTGVALDGLITLLVKLNELAHLPGVTSFHAASPSPGLLLFYYGLLFFAASEGFWLLRKEGKRMRICMMLLLVLGLSLLCPLALEKNLDQADLCLLYTSQSGTIVSPPIVIAAMLEAERIAKDPSVKGYTDLNELFADLKK